MVGFLQLQTYIKPQSKFGKILAQSSPKFHTCTSLYTHNCNVSKSRFENVDKSYWKISPIVIVDSNTGWQVKYFVYSPIHLIGNKNAFIVTNSAKGNLIVLVKKYFVTFF